MNGISYSIKMCGRFVISSKNAFNLEYNISYNVCPSQLVPVKTKEKSLLMKWSYSPLWKQDLNPVSYTHLRAHETN